MNGLRLAYHLTKGILKINRLDSTTPIVLNSTKDKTGLRRTQSPFSVSGFLFHSTEQQESSGDRQARRHRLKVKTTWKPWQKLKKGQRVTEWLPCPWWTGEERKCPSRVPTGHTPGVASPPQPLNFPSHTSHQPLPSGLVASSPFSLSDNSTWNVGPYFPLE